MECGENGYSSEGACGLGVPLQTDSSYFSFLIHRFFAMGKRVAGKPKQKSIKSKAINKNSKRKLDVFGKKQKKGYAGEAVMYMSRAQAIRKLDLTLKDFR